MRVSTTVFQNAFGKFLKLAMNGDDVIVTKNGKGVAKLIKYEDPMIYVVNEGASEYYIRRRVTYEEYLEISEKSQSRYELIDGELHLMASPKRRHQIAVQEIFVQLYHYFQYKACNPIVAPFDVRLYNDSESFEDDPNVVQPDILVICDEEKMGDNDQYYGIPTLVVEVLSRSTRSKDMVKKLDLYMKSGVKEYWIIDPELRKGYLYIFENRGIQDLQAFKYGDDVESVCFEKLKLNMKNI